MTVTDPDTERGLYGKYRVEKVNGKPIGRVFVLDYDNDPHARVALEAYADSCGDEYPQLASDLYRELGIDATVATVDMTEGLALYLAEYYPGRWVAVSEGSLIAAGDSLEDARKGVTGRQRVTLLYVPRPDDPRLT